MPKSRNISPIKPQHPVANPPRATRAQEQLVAKRILGFKRDRKRVRQWNGGDGHWQVSAQWRALDLSGIGLTHVPPAVRTIRDMEILDLSNNRIEELPPWIGELTWVKGISLIRNRLTGLPPDIHLLDDLVFLLLQHNRLESLPANLRNLRRLTRGGDTFLLGLRGNPRLEIPDSVLERVNHPSEILSYYFASRGHEGRPLLELKLLLVGRGRAGKTTIVKRLADETPSADESETHSIAIRELTLECERGDVRTHAWDFGGQDILHATHQFFLTERSLYVVVLEPRSGLAQRDAEYWLKLIETQGGGSPVIVAMNWSRDRPWRVDEVKLRRKFSSIVAFVSTDALAGDGIEQLRNVIVTTVDHMPDVWLPFPQRWRAIKDTVSSMKGNFLSYAEYADLCEQHGEHDSKAQEDLAGILHALGLALYFGKDPRLYDTRVLNPGWVTGAVYAVIRAPSVAQRDGQLALSDMPRVLREAEEAKVIEASDYPPSTHAFILELMRAFQLSYASEEEDGKPARYLVPELLPGFEPEMAEPWNEAPIHVRYRYEVLPPGLLPRFIVRTHALSEAAPHWRHGVVLRHEHASALVREETDRPELHVFVSGSDPDTRRLLVAIVRRELELLHAELKMDPVVGSPGTELEFAL